MRVWLLSLLPTLFVASSVWAAAEGFVIADVSVNGLTQRQAMILVKRDGTIFARREDVTSWNIDVQNLRVERVQNIDHICLSTIPNLRVHLHGENLTIEASESVFQGTQIDLQKRLTSALDGGSGAYLNYDFSAFAARGERATTAGAIEGIFYADTFSVASNGVFSNGLHGSKFVRYESNAQWDFPDRASSLVAGDAIARSGTIARSFRFGGLSYGTNFATRPDMVTFALPAVPGESRIPTSADLLINGISQSRLDLNAGPFEIRNVPAITGAGEIQLVTRDALGRQQVLTVPYYVAASLLRPGFTDAGFEIGKVREDFGIQSFQYGRYFARGVMRHGVTPSLTAEAFAETDCEQHVAGGGLTTAIGKVAIASAAFAASDGAKTGSSYSASLERSSRGLSFGLRGQYTTRYFSQIGELTGTHYRVNASTGISLASLGSVSLVYAVESRYDRGRIATSAISYQQQLGKWLSLLANFSVTRNDVGTRHFAGLVLAIPLDALSSASVSSTRQDRVSEQIIDMRQNLPVDEGWAARARVTQTEGSRARIDAGLSRQNGFGLWSGEVSHSDAGQNFRVGANGSLVMAGGIVRAVRQLGDAFAIVSIPGYPGVDVFHENHRVGQTDAAGFAVIPRLRAYELNAINLDTLKLSLSTELSSSRRTVKPARRAGVLVQFKATEAHGAMVQVVNTNGVAVPAGALLMIAGEAFSFARNGEAWVTGLDTEKEAVVEWPNARCTVRIPQPDRTKARPRIGPLTCRGEGV